jgi:hypothetical protein
LQKDRSYATLTAAAAAAAADPPLPPSTLSPLLRASCSCIAPTTMSPNTAPVKWAQRSDSLYLTIALPDVKDEKLDLSKEKLSFR